MSSGSTTTSTGSSSSSLSWLNRIEFTSSWITQLSSETRENLQKSLDYEGLSEDENDNRTKRPIYNGHYVLVQPTPHPNPKLLLYSKQVAFDMLSLSQEQVESADFLNYVSGNISPTSSWATPYALSIMGTPYTHNCPYGTGHGYGDGRAISIGEWNGYELQLKGAGKTPFHRGADGRAVLRSSIREFLASESMAHLGIPSTRALSLIESSATVQRPWYSEGAVLQLPDMNDPRLANYTDEQKAQILRQLRNEKADPNILVSEQCAITCRVAPSFVRVGHLDLFARRVQDMPGSSMIKDSLEYKELEQMIWHACFREFKQQAYDPYIEDKNIQAAANALLKLSAERIAQMTAGWLRVGFAQGNFNGDNCLISGTTMDYGPFGWMEEYSPTFAKWTGSGPHFGFLNQPTAGYANFKVLVESVAQVIPDPQEQQVFVEEHLARAKTVFETEVDQVFRKKLGLDPGNEAGDELWSQLEPLMRKTRVDWTIFWRQLSHIQNEEQMLVQLEPAFYEPLSQPHQEEYMDWLTLWWKEKSKSQPQVDMLQINPKYVLREWMLVKAYQDAAQGNYQELHNLNELIQNPYKEGTTEQSDNYYKRANADALTKGGTAFMS